MDAEHYVSKIKVSASKNFPAPWIISGYVFMADFKTNTRICQIKVDDLDVHEIKMGHHNREVILTKATKYPNANDKNVEL